MSLLRAAAKAVSRSGPHAALLVLMYHRVLPQPDPMLPDEPDAVRFSALMDAVRAVFSVVDLADGLRTLKEGRLPAGSVAITFDDGYANNLEIAAPALCARGLRATCFVATGHRDGSRMWNDVVIDALRVAPPRLDLSDFGLGVHFLPDIEARRMTSARLLNELKYLDSTERTRIAAAIAAGCGGLPKTKVMMTDADLRQLQTHGIAIGAHCISHPILARVPDSTAESEIRESRVQLESALQTPVRSFAYPNGRPGQDYGQQHVRMVRESGYECAVTTAWGAAVRACDAFQVPRIAPWDRSALRYVLRIIRAFGQRRPVRA